MTPIRFVDTNVLLYAVSALSEDSAKRLRALDLLLEDNLAVSVQVLAEFYHQATRDRRPAALSHDHALQFIERIGHLTVQNVTLEVFRTGVSISRRYQVSYWDGAILAAARALGCNILYSENLNHDQDYGDVRVINPFVSS